MSVLYVEKKNISPLGSLDKTYADAVKLDSLTIKEYKPSQRLSSLKSDELQGSSLKGTPNPGSNGDAPPLIGCKGASEPAGYTTLEELTDTPPLSPGSSDQEDEPANSSSSVVEVEPLVGLPLKEATEVHWKGEIVAIFSSDGEVQVKELFQLPDVLTTQEVDLVDDFVYKAFCTPRLHPSIVRRIYQRETSQSFEEEFFNSTPFFIIKGETEIEECHKVAGHTKQYIARGIAKYLGGPHVGWPVVTVSGAYASTLDPKFLAPENREYHLRPHTIFCCVVGVGGAKTGFKQVTQEEWVCYGSSEIENGELSIPSGFDIFGWSQDFNAFMKIDSGSWPKSRVSYITSVFDLPSNIGLTGIPGMIYVVRPAMTKEEDSYDVIPTTRYFKYNGRGYVEIYPAAEDLAESNKCNFIPASSFAIQNDRFFPECRQSNKIYFVGGVVGGKKGLKNATIEKIREGVSHAVEEELGLSTGPGSGRRREKRKKVAKKVLKAVGALAGGAIGFATSRNFVGTRLGHDAGAKVGGKLADVIFGHGTYKIGDTHYNSTFKNTGLKHFDGDLNVGRSSKTLSEGRLLEKEVVTLGQIFGVVGRNVLYTFRMNPGDTTTYPTSVNSLRFNKFNIRQCILSYTSATGINMATLPTITFVATSVPQNMTTLQEIQNTSGTSGVMVFNATDNARYGVECDKKQFSFKSYYIENNPNNDSAVDEAERVPIYIYMMVSTPFITGYSELQQLPMGYLQMMRTTEYLDSETPFARPGYVHVYRNTNSVTTPWGLPSQGCNTIQWGSLANCWSIEETGGTNRGINLNLNLPTGFIFMVTFTMTIQTASSIIPWNWFFDAGSSVGVAGVPYLQPLTTPTSASSTVGPAGSYTNGSTYSYSIMLETFGPSALGSVTSDAFGFINASARPVVQVANFKCNTPTSLAVGMYTYPFMDVVIQAIGNSASRTFNQAV